MTEPAEHFDCGVCQANAQYARECAEHDAGTRCGACWKPIEEPSDVYGMCVKCLIRREEGIKPELGVGYMRGWAE